MVQGLEDDFDAVEVVEMNLMKSMFCVSSALGLLCSL